MSLKRHDSEQVRIGISSVVIASFIAVIQIKDTIGRYISTDTANFLVSLLFASALFGFIFLLCIGLETRYTRSTIIPSLAFLEKNLHKQLIQDLKKRCYDFSINIYILAPIMVLSFLCLNNLTWLGLKPGPGDPAGGTLYLFSIFVGLMAWNFMGNIIAFILLVIGFIEKRPRLRILFWSLSMIVFSQALFVLRDDKCLSDVQWVPLAWLTGMIVAILLLLPAIEKVIEDK